MLSQMISRLWMPASGVVVCLGLLAHLSSFDARVLAWTTTRAAAKPSSAKEPGAAVHETPRVIAEGRVVAYPGAEVVVGTEVAGRIVRLNVEEKSVVRNGDLIAELNADDLQAALAEAVARIREAEADIRFFDREVRREESLLSRRAGTQQNLDTNCRGLATARARREAAVAQRDHQQALIDKTRIVAPIDGVITARAVHPGETVYQRAHIVTVADLSRLRIEAEVDEYDTGRVELGSRVVITAEGYPGKSWQGIVEEIPDSVIGRRSRPEDPGRPIDARVLPIKVAFRESTPLKLGQRVEVELTHRTAK
jgi:multidrug efflux pump subunit AcrA (membrane-fusion protein)